MHELDPFMRFLGIAETTDPRELLGLPPGKVDTRRVDAALRRRLEQIYNHPDGRSAGAERVRQTLRHAADQLRSLTSHQHSSHHTNGASVVRNQITDRPDFSAKPRPRRELTDFDRHVIATLVGAGGWNAQSRAQLVSLAATYDVTPDGLMTVMRGLNDYGRSGGDGGFDLHNASATAPRAPYVRPRRREPGVIMRAAVEAAERLTPELREPSLGTTVKLAVFFGVLTIVAGTVLFAVLISRGIGDDPNDSVAGDSGGVVEPIDDIAKTNGRERSGGLDSNRYGRLARFETPPTFLGNGLPSVITDAADESIELPDHLEQLSRQIEVSSELSLAMTENWRTSVSTIATGWTSSDTVTRRAVDEHIIEIMRLASSTPSMSDALLVDLLPTTGRAADPIDLIRGAWKAGTMARIAASGLSPVVTAQADRLLRSALPQLPGALNDPFRQAGRHWLIVMIPSLVEQAHYDPGYDDFWELWLVAHRALAESALNPAIAELDMDDALIDALTALVRSDADLSRDGPIVSIIGRLLNLLQYATNPRIKRRMLDWFDDPRINIDDIWVVCSLLSLYNKDTTWMTPELVPTGSGERDSVYRRRFRDRIAQAWPDVVKLTEKARRAAGTALQVDPVVRRHWNDLYLRLGALPTPFEQSVQMRRLLMAIQLNESAALLAGQEVLEAEHALTAIELLFDDEHTLSSSSSSSQQQRSSRRSRSTGRIGQAIGADGQWAAMWGERSRSTDHKINLLTQLRNAGGTDLGPIDAALFVRQVYRGSPAEVRSLAQEVLVDRFSLGPNVAVELLDQFPGASTSLGFAAMLEQLLAVQPGETRSQQWRINARLALADHALSLRQQADHTVDVIADLITESYDERLMHLEQRDQLTMSVSDAPQDAALRVQSYWEKEASSLMATVAVPTGLTGIARRNIIRGRLANGSIQQFVVAQVGIVDLLAYVTVAEQPALESTVRAVLADAITQRAGTGNILAQAIEAEQAMSRLWRLRMGGDPAAASAGPTPDNTEVRARPRRLVDTVETDEIQRGIMRAAFASALIPGGSFTRIGRAPMTTVDWTARLEALHPEQPMSYFELAEEVADVARSEQDELLARRLFALAGTLAPQRLGRSACLALADLEGDRLAKRRLLALAALLDDRGSSGLLRFDADPDMLADRNAAVAVFDIISLHRRGQGAKAEQLLDQPGVLELIQGLDRMLPGGSARFLEDLRLYRSGQKRPQMLVGQIETSLHIQAGLLGENNRDWSADLLLRGAEPLIEVDPTDLPGSLSVDPTRPFYRDGQWRSQ